MTDVPNDYPWPTEGPAEALQLALAELAHVKRQITAIADAAARWHSDFQNEEMSVNHSANDYHYLDGLDDAAYMIDDIIQGRM